MATTTPFSGMRLFLDGEVQKVHVDDTSQTLVSTVHVWRVTGEHDEFEIPNHAVEICKTLDGTKILTLKGESDYTLYFEWYPEELSITNS